ncbi:MAG: cardiolipin synthase [Chromatiaceae bacterium]|nr:cardiolipin synthase [Chromatiaceae bacterium]
MNLQIFSTFVLIVHWLIVAGLSIRVIMRRSPVGVALAWLSVIASAPFVGAGAYLLLGERRLGARRAARITANIGSLKQWQARLRDNLDPASVQVDVATEPMRQHAEHVLGYPILPGNRIELLDNFRTVFDAMITDIDSAHSRCHLCFYIWHDGGRVADLIEALVRAARRGVQCRALADAMGSKAFLKDAQARRLRDAGVELTAALPTGLLRALFVRQDLRNHRKILVIDDRVAYTGSQNLVDPRFFKQNVGVGEWVDAIARITGPTAAALDSVFELDWSVEIGREYEQPRAIEHAARPSAGSMIQVVPSGQDLRPQAIHQLLLTAIYSARRELVMTTPYFVPDDSMLTALLSAALRGVAVTLIVPARNDSVLVRYASVAHFDDLMSAGVNIALFKGGLLHTKSLAIDGEFSVFGSVNLDMRSLWLNFEISLFVYDAAFTQQLSALQHNYLANSDLLDPEAWRRRPAWRRFTENALRLLGPIL